ncbi:sialidase family protein [Synergistes jonesii]|uniref:Glycosyl hydrolase family 32 N-terminal domain-containing protein n=1 Tax=Synergistes jonesii TaxID=2754 RepID=A0A073J4Y7_9BACT|nr:sialidase family protein [Synergistes jonesii]KEJ92787.1 hypothetical protein EH55_01000 [Synergistes jonesii]OFB62426.1 hypothetical protein JS72_08535 [Synergistes jonesii]OFB63721.1 hypothetical protein JS73_04325 [Synergistes jonesii]OFB65040.1 hypothetical protein JS79_04880 [Synergistes jonesii]OFB68230.1 hypothetical protein JS78_04345 [Synergistes jonesii]
MNKFKREAIRIGMRAAVRFPALLPRALAKYFKKLWNKNQLENARVLYAAGNFSPRKEELPHGMRILDLSCTSGFGESVHPCARYIPEGIGEGRWRYVMTLTPLPQGIEYFENPEFLVSADGEEWRLPRGGKSPLIPAPSDWVGYNSDPALHCEGGKIYLIYRRSEYMRSGASVRLLVTETEDCVNWSAPSVMMEEFHGERELAVLMSPSVVKRGGEYFLWYVDGAGGVFSIMRARSGDMLGWREASAAEISGLPEGVEPWHAEVIEKDESELLMTLCYQRAGNYKSDRGIAFASSRDGGVSWRVFGDAIEPGKYNFCKKSLYKGSLLKDERGAFRLYFSGQDEENHWFTALKSSGLPL